MVVPTNTPPEPLVVANKALRAMEYERKLEDQEKFTGWAVIWVLFGFKMGTVAIIWFMARSRTSGNSNELEAYLASTTWYWFIIPAIALSGLIAYRLRLRRARQNVDTLRQAEFAAHHHPAEHAPLSAEEKNRLAHLVGRREDLEVHDDEPEAFTRR